MFRVLAFVWFLAAASGQTDTGSSPAMRTTPAAWCNEDGGLHMGLHRAELILRDERPVLGLRGRHFRPSTLSSARLFQGARPVDRVDYRIGDDVMSRLLIQDNGWQIVESSTPHPLKVPVGFRRGIPPLLVGASSHFAWFVSATHLARVDLDVDGDGVISAKLNRRLLGSTVVEANERLKVLNGRRLLSCSAQLRCEEIASLQAPVRSIVGFRDGYLVATDRSVDYVELNESRVGDAAVDSRPVKIEEISNEGADTLCGGIYAWLVRDKETTLEFVRVNSSLELRSFSLLEILERALPVADSHAVEAWADALVEAHWPGRRSLAEKFSDSKSASLRRVAALLWGGEPGNGSLARLWLLGHDADVAVRLAAVHASATWCQRDRKMPCRAVLAAFVNDPYDEVSSTARDFLLADDPWAALEGAPASYRLAAISSLSSRWQRYAEPHVFEVLERLSTDVDPKVREAARMAVIQE